MKVQRYITKSGKKTSGERTPFVVITGILLLVAVGAILLFCNLPIGKPQLNSPDPRTSLPREMPLMTIEMNLDIVYNALASAKACVDVNDPYNILRSNLEIMPAGDKAKYDQLIPENIAIETAKSYPHLFAYDTKDKSFTFKVTKAKEGYVVMPTWLVVSMIDNGLLRLPN